MEAKDNTLTIVKQLTNNLREIAALPFNQQPEKRFRELRKLDDEKDSDYRVRALKVIGDWWGYAASTVRAMEDGSRSGRDSAPFLEDLRKYGAVQFSKKDGSIIERSLNKGLTALDYARALAARKAERRAGIAASL